MNRKLQQLKVGLSIKELFFLLFLICASGFSTFIQLASLLLFSVGFMFVGKEIKFIGRWFFYAGLMLISLLQILLFWLEDYSSNFIFNTLLISLMWFLALQSSNIIIRSVFSFENFQIERILKIFFKLNLILSIFQIIVMSYDMNTFFPFSNMSAGDNVKGFFRNSSVHMIIMSFFMIFYMYRREYKNMIIAVLLMVLTFYMSGLLLFIIVFSSFVFFTFSFKIKLRIISGLLIGVFLFAKFSPDNVTYVQNILTEKINSRTDPPRKIVSFSQTLSHWISDPITFIFGSGGGKFSSRTAFITGGDYVGGFPKSLIYRSTDFEENHFSLWNLEILSRPYKDGTSNQPFSFYNKIIGEYGLIGVVLFLCYLFSSGRYYKKLTYSKIIITLLLFYFLLDYWFEYFSVIIFLELFLYLDIKNQMTINNEK